MARMKRLQISIEPELDAALGAEARELGISKAAFVRRVVADRLTPLPPLQEDPLWEMVGADPDGEPGDVDEVVYGDKTRERA